MTTATVSNVNTESENIMDIVPDASQTGVKIFKEGSSPETVLLNADQIHVNYEMNITDDSRFSDESIEKLMNQIQTVGKILQSVVVQRVEPSPQTGNKPYVLTMGFRRMTAVHRLYAKTGEKKWLENIPAQVVQYTSFAAMRAAQVVENIARQTIGPVAIARSIQKILEPREKGGEKIPSNFTQSDIAAVFQMTPSQVSQYLKLLNLPLEIQQALEENLISFSHARVLVYDVPAEKWKEELKNAKELDFGPFQKLMRERYKKAEEKKEGEGEGEGEPKEGAAAKQKAPTLVPASDVTKVFVPFLEQELAKAAEAGDTEKKYTESDLLQARLDAVYTVMRRGDTRLSAMVAPYKQAIAEQEIKEEKEEAAKKAYEQFIHDVIKETQEILSAPVDPLNLDTAKSPAAVLSETVTKAVNAHDEAKDGFALPATEQIAQDVRSAYIESVKAEKERRAKRQAAKEEAKKKKEAEKLTAKINAATDQASESSAEEHVDQTA